MKVIMMLTMAAMLAACAGEQPAGPAHLETTVEALRAHLAGQGIHAPADLPPAGKAASSATAPVKGDGDGNGAVEFTDLLLLWLHLKGAVALDAGSLDVDGDGALTFEDLAALGRYLFVDDYANPHGIGGPPAGDVDPDTGGDGTPADPPSTDPPSTDPAGDVALFEILVFKAGVGDDERLQGEREYYCRIGARWEDDSCGIRRRPDPPRRANPGDLRIADDYKARITPESWLLKPPGAGYGWDNHYAGEVDGFVYKRWPGYNRGDYGEYITLAQFLDIINHGRATHYAACLEHEDLAVGGGERMPPAAGVGPGRVAADSGEAGAQLEHLQRQLVAVRSVPGRTVSQRPSTCGSKARSSRGGRRARGRRRRARSRRAGERRRPPLKHILTRGNWQRPMTSRQAKWMKKRGEARRSEGQCYRCGEPVDLPPPPARRKRGRPRTGAYCRACLDALNNRTETGRDG